MLPADAALSREIVFGVLRRRPQLDFLIQRHLKGPISRLDTEVLVALRMGAFQLRFLERIPAHAVVSESVAVVKLARKSSASGVVNAVLRKVSTDALADEWPSRELSYCQPEWLLNRWVGAYGEQRAIGIAEAFLRKPEVYVRIPPGKTAEDFPGCILGETEIPGCFRVEKGSPLAAGLRQMDIGSQWVASFVAAGRDEPVLDLCAAPGNKTSAIGERAPIAAACDLHLRRLLAMPGAAHARVQLNAAFPLPFRRRFPWILLDAPCSGTGTLGRNPEIRWRLTPQALAAFPALQREMLQNALQLLAPGGTLVYSTCSLEIEENECIVTEVCHDYHVEMFHRLPGESPGDGFFVARIRAV